MLLASLFPDVTLSSNPDVTTLCEDTRRITPGAVFFAHVGSKQNGLEFVSDAVMRGCVAIVVPDNVPTPSVSVPVIRVKNTRAELARASAVLYPDQPANIVAVTGTAGKTSTAYFVQQFLNLLDHRAVSIGTIGINGAVTRELSLTTPEAPILHATLDDLAHQGITHAVMEASSQAIIQHRLDAVHLRAAAFTNLSRDHLDYHATMDEYFAAKARLFAELLPPDGTAVLNTDDARYAELNAIAQKRGLKVISFGRTPNATLRLTDQTLTTHGQTIIVMAEGGTHRMDMSVAGAFQVDNILTAVGLCRALGIHLDDLVAVAPQLVAPPGRLQAVNGHPTGAAIYVDYAHKPGALEHVLTALRAHNPHRLVCVFGCGGDRDAGKRPIMGEIATRLSDDVIVTDDNPRSEDPATIRATIMAAAPGAQNIGDRATAIQTAIQNLQEGDILVIAGKGHEHGQKFATHTEPFDDVAVAAAAIKSLLNTPTSRPTTAA